MVKKPSLTLSKEKDLYRGILGAKTACTDTERGCQFWQKILNMQRIDIKDPPLPLFPLPKIVS